MAIEFRKEGPWELPEGWVWARLGDIAEINPTTRLDDLPDDAEVLFLPMAAVAEETGIADFSQRRAAQDVRKGYTRFKNGDVLFAKITPCMENGKSVPILDLPTEYGAGSTEFHVIRSPHVDVRYLWYWVVRKAFRDKAQRNMSGSAGQLRVPVGYLQDALIPVAPAAEQRRIVARIDALFTEIADGETALTRARTDLDTWRRALLKAAVTGELTREWRAGRKSKETGGSLATRFRRQRPAVPSTMRGWSYDKKTLPASWAWAAVEEVGEVQLGRQRAPQHHNGEHMRPYLRVANVFEGRLELSDVKRMNFTPQEFMTFCLRSGDLLLNEGQSPHLLGRPAIYREEIEGCCFQNTLLRFRPYSGIDSEFALLVFRHYMHSGRFKREARITTNIAHLSRTRFATIEFPVPPTEEQSVIAQLVRAVELDAEDQVGAMEASPIFALRQSILKFAFEGRLTGQVGTDEPAEALLARLSPSVANEGLPRAPHRRKAAQ